MHEDLNWKANSSLSMGDSARAISVFGKIPRRSEKQTRSREKKRVKAVEQKEEAPVEEKVETASKGDQVKEPGDEDDGDFEDAAVVWYAETMEEPRAEAQQDGAWSETTCISVVASVIAACMGGCASSMWRRNGPPIEPEAEADPEEEPEPAPPANPTRPSTAARPTTMRSGMWGEPQLEQRARMKAAISWTPCPQCNCLHKTSAGSNNFFIQWKCVGCGRVMARERTCVE